MHRRLWTLATDTIDSLRGHDVAVLAAGLTFFAAISLVPLLLIIAFLVAQIVGGDEVRRFASELLPFVPETLRIDQAAEALATQGPALGWSTALAALLTASTYGEGLLRVFSRLDGQRRDSNATVWGRLRFLWVLAAAPLVAVVGLLAVSQLPDVLGEGGGPRLLGLWATFWVGWLASSLLLGLIYQVFSGRSLRWRALVWGALATGSFLTGMTLGWVLYLRLGLLPRAAFGGSEMVAALVLAAVYLFFFQMVVLVGYALTLQLQTRDGRPTAPSGRSSGARATAPRDATELSAS